MLLSYNFGEYVEMLPVFDDNLPFPFILMPLLVSHHSCPYHEISPFCFSIKENYSPSFFLLLLCRRGAVTWMVSRSFTAKVEAHKHRRSIVILQVRDLKLVIISAM